MSDENIIELENEFIVLAIPATTVEVKISAKVWNDGDVIDVERTMPFNEVRDAIKEARECYIPSDALFTITDLGRAELEKLKQRYTEDEQ